MLTLNEMFYSIQGESTYAGRPCVFIRLTACDLRCSWCDTPYAFNEGQKVAVDDIVNRALAFKCPLVEITGGEPLLQEEVYALMGRLIAAGETVLLETGGHIDIGRVPAAVIKIMDIKCPASGEVEHNHWENLGKLQPSDQVKFVIRDRTDYEFARATLCRHQLERICAAVLFAPVHGVLEPRTLSEWVLEDALPVRVQLQLHKYIWGPEVRGV